MDILAHGLWTNVVFYKKYQQEKKQRYLAVLFGVLPDFVSFAPAFLYLVFSRSRFGVEAFHSGVWVFRYASISYSFTHSLVMFAAVLVLVTALRRGRQYWPLWGWALHIVIDIFSHKNFYTTPFLYPISNYKFTHGYSWGHPMFMLINYSALAGVYLIWFFVSRKKNGPSRK